MIFIEVNDINKTLEDCSNLIKEWFIDSQSKVTTTSATTQPAWKQYAFSGTNSFASTGGNSSSHNRHSSEDMK